MNPTESSVVIGLSLEEVTIPGHVDLLEDMGVLTNNSLHEVEICCAQSRPSIKDTSEIEAILFLVRRPRLKGDVGHGAMDHDRDMW